MESKNSIARIIRPIAYNTLNDGQKDAFDKMAEGGRNWFLTGNAGTGKSYLARVFTDACQLSGLCVAKCAPTGIAAVNIGGTTLHRMFKLANNVEAPKAMTQRQKDNIMKTVYGIDVLFIDEISMARRDYLDSVLRQVYVSNQRRAKHGRKPTQVIVCGDFCQLPPVATEKDKADFAQLHDAPMGSGYAFLGGGWKNMNFQGIVLTQVMRQGDAEFCGALDKIRMGDSSGLGFIMANSAKNPIDNAIWLCGKNDTVEAKNRECLDAIDEPEYRSEARIRGDAKIDDTNLEKNLVFKTGARVVMLANTKSGLYANGTMGTIIDAGAAARGGEVGIRMDSGAIAWVGPLTIDITTLEITDGKAQEKIVGSVTQYPFKLGYAMTIHKAQGQTFDAVNLVPQIFADGQLYVALSRVTSLSRMYIDTYQRPMKYMRGATRTHADVKKFMAGLDRAS